MEMCESCIEGWLRFALCTNLHPHLDAVTDGARGDLPHLIPTECLFVSTVLQQEMAEFPARAWRARVRKRYALYSPYPVGFLQKYKYCCPKLIPAEHCTFVFISSFHRHRNSWSFWQFVSLSRIWVSVCW